MNTTMSFAALADLIRQLPPSAGTTSIVGIDGGGGAGKSTFAARLAHELRCPVIHTDDFASWDNPLDWWPRLLDQVLEPFSRGEPASYQRYDWEQKSLAEWHEVQSPLVLLEGVSATRAEFRPYLAYRVWVECPPEVRLKRGLERDGLSMEGQWRVWMAEEDRYVAEHQPHRSADLWVDGSRQTAPDEFPVLSGDGS